MSAFFIYLNMELNKEETLIAQLAILIEADGKVDENEKQLLTLVADRFGINDNRLLEVLSNLNFVKFSYPKLEQARAENLYTLFMMINSDNHIDIKEKNMIVALGLGLGFRDEMIKELIDRSILSDHQLKVEDFVKALGKYS